MPRCPSCGGDVQTQDPEGAACPTCGTPVAVGDDPGATAPAPASGEEASTAPILEELPADGPTLPQGRPGALMPARLNISLAIVGGDRAGEVVRLERSSCVIGRADPNGTADIQLDDPTLSLAHATVECLGGLVILRDLGSHNGTFVDEQRVETATLEDRAEFRVGHTSVMVILTPKEPE